jgi:dTDP-glucose 4,6-dehydratase
MRVIITGGAGFIGGHTVKHFVELGDVVINVDKLTYASNFENIKHSEFLKLDICEKKELVNLIEKFSPDFLINFAAETHVDNSINDNKEFLLTNILGAASVIDACRLTGVKLCHVSTDEVYGPASDRPFVEEDKLNPMNPYSATKAAADLMLEAYRNTYNLDYLVVRPSNNYGPKQHPEKFIPKFLKCIAENKKFPLYGDGAQEREWTYVEDTVKIIRKLLISEKTNWKKNSIYNLSSGITFTNLETAKTILRTYNELNTTDIKLADVLTLSADRLGHDRKYWISSEKLDNTVKHDYISFESGIKEIIKTYEKHS